MFFELFQKHYSLHVLFRANYDFRHSHTCDIKAHSVKTYTFAINPLVPELNALNDWQKTRI